MDTAYSDGLKKVMSLIISQAPKAEILKKAKELKIQLTTAWSELQRVINLLDGMVTQYAPDKEWPMGFWLPPPTMQSSNIGVRSVIPMVQNRRVSFVTSRERIVEIARREMIDSTVHTKVIIAQLRTEGDQRPERFAAISIGNILTDNGWKRIDVGKYKAPEEQKGKEGTTTP